MESDSLETSQADVVAAFERERGTLENFLWGLLRDRECVADALQTTFLRLIENQRDVDPAKLRAWLFRVSRNEALLILRRAKIEQSKLESAHWWKSPANFPDPNDQLQKVEQIERLRAVWSRLSNEHRDLLTCRIHEGMKFAEIASQMGLPIGTVLTRMRAAVNRLRQLLENSE